MKQIIISLLAAITLFACSAPEYKITGTIEGAADGDSVQLGYSNNGIDFTAVATTTITDGQFQFTGKQDGCKIYYISYPKEESPIYALFFLEGGEITADIALNYSNITGTPMNDLNIQIEDSLESYVIKMLNLQDKIYRDSTLSDESKALIYTKNDSIQHEAMAYIQNTIVDNIDNMVGLFLLVQYSDLFDNEELADLIAAVPAASKDPDNNPLFDILLEVQTMRTTDDAMDDISNSINEGIEDFNLEEGEGIIE